MTAGVVFLINLFLTIVAVSKYGLQSGLGTVQEGSCDKTRNLSLWLHLAINVLGTLLLGASNYCMQCISSPTRLEINKAHSRGVWLDIGIPSVRNLRRISWSRIGFWWLLALSSIPLHLLYNSAVFESLSTREYDVYVVSKDWVSGANFSIGDQGAQGRVQQIYSSLGNHTAVKNLSNADCVKAYQNPVVAGRSNVLLVTSLPDITKDETNNSVLNYLFDVRPGFDYAARYSGFSYPNESDWTCFTQAHCNTSMAVEVVADPSAWSSQLSSVQYCLSQLEEDHCKLQWSVVIMLIVIVCNFAKTTCMAILAWRKDMQPLTTLGDALASFLDDPDPTTKGQCLAGRDHFQRHKTWKPLAMKWKPQSHSWFSSASGLRWLVCNLLCLATLIVATILLQTGITNIKLSSPDTSIAYLRTLGFGAVNGQAIMTIQFPGGASGLMITVLLANSPQALLSFLYLTYNGLFTCMLHAQEWSGYASERKPLRVTSPKGEQRSTYRLQLPYKYGIPLLILSGTLHWLVSQSIFLARITTLGLDGTLDHTQSVSTCGYSPIAIITVIIVGAIVVLLGLANGFRRYKAGIPLVGSCSAAISAACHPPESDVDAALKPILWGVVDNEGSEHSDEPVGHCTFTSLSVDKPVQGNLYAGREII